MKEFKSDNLADNKQVLTVKLYNETKEDEKLNKALLVLLGGYNIYGRQMDLEYYHELQKQFNIILDKIDYAIHN
jgi:hypothetical protein